MIRKTVFAILAAAAILPFVSCNKEGREAPAEADGENLVTITISASTHSPESEVKAALQSDGKVFWEDGDKIAVYDGYALREFTLTSGAGSSSGSFRGEISASATSIEAVYPYAAAYLENKVLKYSLPDQVIPSGKLADPAALVSKAEPVAPGSSLFFRNKATLFKFNAPAAGNVYFVSSCGDGNFGAPDRRTLTVNCPSAGTFYAAVVPGDYNGFNAFSNGKIKKATKPFSLPANGIVNLGDVTGTEDVTLIWNASELNAFLASPSKPGYVMASIDASYGITGADTFSGTLDGQGNEIHKWMASGEALVGTNSGTVKDIILASDCVLTFPSPIKDNFGFIVCTNSGSVSGCRNEANISWTGAVEKGLGTSSYTGAIVGNSSAPLTGCVNNGNISVSVSSVSVNSAYWGGVTGRIGNSTLKGCANNGNFALKYTVTSSKNNYIGGVTPVCNGTCTVSGCRNGGNVTFSTPEGGAAVTMGGVVGYAGGGTMSECINVGKVACTSSAGIHSTVIGGVCAYHAGSVTDCDNTGAVELTGKSFKGVNAVGSIDGTKSTAYPSVIAGGIVGAGAPSSAESFKFQMARCNNGGAVKVNLTAIDSDPAPEDASIFCIGGLVGDASGPVSNSVNGGRVETKLISSSEYTAANSGYTVYTGGIAGANYYSKTQNNLDITDCDNSGEVYFRSDNRRTKFNMAAGIAGYPGNTDTDCKNLTKGCTNTGAVTGEGYAQTELGGIHGHSGRMENCRNEGAVTGSTAVCRLLAGGLAAFHTSGQQVAGCTNLGDVTTTNTVSNSAIGGLIGLIGNSEHETGAACTVDCRLKTAGSISRGMIMGMFNGTTKEIKFGSASAPVVVSGTVKDGSATAVALNSSNYKDYICGSNFTVGTHIIISRYITDPEPAPKDTELNGTTIAESSNLYGLITDKASGKGIKGVPVTDGYKYVLTDANGVYQMTADSRCLCVTMSLPSAYKMPMDEDRQVPAFYANDLDFSWFSRRDFVLEQAAPQTQFTIGAIGDAHIGRKSMSTGDWVQLSSQRLRNQTFPDMCNHFIEENLPNPYAISVGDESNSNNMNQWPSIKAVTENILMSNGKYLPFLHCMGNHDHMGDCGKTEADFYVNQRKRFVQFCGPADYSLNIGDAHIVVLDNAAYNGATAYRLYDDSWKWLQADLSLVENKANKLLIMVFHCPMRGGEKLDDEIAFTDHRVDILNLMKDFHQAHIIDGHTHKTHEWIHSDYKTKDGTAIHEHVLGMAGGTYWHYYNCPDGSPYSYTVFKIDGNEIVDYYLKAIGKPKDFQMRVYDGSAAITAPGSSNKYYWYNATNTMTNSSGKSYNAQGNSALKGCFVANIWCANDDWTLELWQNGTKKGTLSRTPEICDVFNAAWIFEDGDANYDEVSRGAQHYYYIKDASSSPGTATNWYIKATHKIPGAHGATHTYTCSSITSSYSPFLWE